MLPFGLHLQGKQNRSIHTVAWQMPRQISNKAITEHLLQTNISIFLGAIPTSPAILQDHKKTVRKKQGHAQ